MEGNHRRTTSHSAPEGTPGATESLSQIEVASPGEASERTNSTCIILRQLTEEVELIVTQSGALDSKSSELPIEMLIIVGSASRRVVYS